MIEKKSNRKGSLPSTGAARTPTGLIVVDHGSRLDESNEMLDTFVGMIRDQARNRFVTVQAAHMELAEPSLDQALQRCVGAGAKRVVVALFFLSPGRHSTHDIPAMAQAAAQRYPDVEVFVSEPLGLDRRLVSLLLDRVDQALAASSISKEVIVREGIGRENG